MYWYCVDKWKHTIYNYNGKFENEAIAEKKKSDHLNIRINPILKEKLMQICQQEHRSQAAQIEY